MLMIRTIICVFSVMALFIAGRIRKSYEPQCRTFLEKICIAMGIIGVIIFGCMLIYDRQFLYMIPKMLLLISSCLYVYFKRRKKCCVPFWRNIKLTAVISVICFMTGIVNSVISNFENAGKPLKYSSIAFLVIVCVVIVVALAVFINKFFSFILNRRRVSSFYY